MPWEKSFNEAEIVDKAMHVFWNRGYQSASIAELVEATGINRGSLYNAFGDKRNLFVKTLNAYDSNTRKLLIADLEALDQPILAIETFFERILDDTFHDPEHKGCFLINTSLELPSHDQEINAFISQRLNEIKAFFRRCIEVAQARELVDRTIKSEPVASALMGLIVSIRVLGRGAFSEESLRNIAEQHKCLLGIVDSE